MPGKSATFENDVCKLVFNATAIGNLADNAAAAPLTSLYLALHTADPTDAGTQASNEVTTAAYNTYTRQAVLRTSAGWTVTASSAALTAAVSFPACTGGTGASISYFSIGVASSGATKILYSGTLSPTITVANGVTPQLTTGTTVTEG